MLKLMCLCGCDGYECEKIIPQVDEVGYVIEPDKDMSLGSWEVCKKCKRNRCVGSCSGYFKLEMVRCKLTPNDIIAYSSPVFDVIPEERFKDSDLTLHVLDYNYDEVELESWEEFLWYCKERGFKFLSVGDGQGNAYATYESDTILDCEWNREVLTELRVDFE